MNWGESGFVMMNNYKLLLDLQLCFGRMQKSATLTDSLNKANRSPLNSSKAKAMFCFPKQSRLPPLKDDTNSFFYDKPSMLNPRAPSFGYGNKIDIALAKSSPSPDKYTLESQFGKSPKKGLTIASGRQDCKSISIFNQTHNPGPGDYNLQHDKENIKNLTMSGKLKFPSLWASSIAPGPGTYDIEAIDSKGLCLTSKYKSKGSFKIQPQSPTKEDKISQMIGPGTYNTSLSSTGKQLLAKNKTEKAFVFGKNIRETMNQKTLSPGPGAYQHYSIFGLL